jgi:hypothetical protein
VADNLFKETNGPALEAVEGVDGSIAPLDVTRANDLLFAGNTFHGIAKRTENPVTRRAVENGAAQVWGVDLADALPFGCEAVAAISALADGVIETAGAVQRFMRCLMRWRGPARTGQAIQLHWSEPVRGAVYLTARCDT